MRLLLILLVIYGQSGNAHAQDGKLVCPEPIQIGFNDWAPYAWIDESGKAVGLDVDMLTLVANNFGCKVQFIQMPVKRAHQMLKIGTLDMMMGASYIPEREEYAYFSDSYRDEEVRLFVEAGNTSSITIDKWQDIFTKKLKLLAPSYGWYGQDYLATKDELSQQGLLITSPNATQSVQMLAYKRGDVLIGDSVALPYIANQSEGLILSPLALVVDTNQIHFMISKKTNNSALLAEINRSISTLSNHGALARVMKKWQQISVAKSQESQQKATPTDSSSGVMNITEQGLIAALNASKRYSAE
ncbi:MULTISPECIES: substrate-binding periplasmic protein [Shewanella]|uniref:Transporter substrate-binding domain-containing protein n=1 Tax=Shewanella holmiensis TaxID=2952222 RepID=A0A9X3AWG3_9GAMM|nr:MULTISPECIES: transporter substrate-binding domain-containing protein [Shewanella]MCT7942318.1 transporter substrate-binding domain-containing protein [Shewanella holmiensis]MDP5146918.1 transporter substrate-binding domain-containing protein [Shewanella sp. ULN5]